MGLVASGSLDRNSFEGCSTEAIPHVDLTSARWVDVYSLVGVACLAEEAKRRGTRLTFTAPEGEEVSRYLARMHLQPVVDDLCDPIFSDGLPDVREHPREDVLVELRRFASEFDLEQLGDFLWQRLRSTVGPHQLNALYTALLELGVNVIEHADSSGGFVAAQAYMVGEASERIELALGDAGQGIPATMARHRPVDDHDALRLALQRDISGTGEPGRGQGLPETVLQTTGLSGNVYLWSGGVKMKIWSPERHTWASKGRSPGTLIGVSIQCA